jgi:hypothetical protein
MIMAGEGHLRTNELVIRSNAVRDWWEGRTVLHINASGSDAWEDRERHWTARTARSLGAFWLKHWQFIVTVAVAIAAVIVNATR